MASHFALIFGLWTCVPVTTYAATTITKSIAAASDDAEEEGPTGTTPNRMWLNSSDIELVSDIEPATCGDQKIGLRFTAMTIPAGATITDAYLTFRAIAADSPMTNSDATNLTIKGQLIANAPTFTTTSGNISSRTVTTASASWTPGSWTTGSDYNSPSIVSVIQEIVDQGTWASGNAVAIIITGTGHRASQAYDSDPATAAKLVVTYSIDLAISSAANQTFKIGDSTTAISAIKVRDDPTSPKITAANDIRIRIPSSFTMTWDTSDTTAPSVVRPQRRSPIHVSYEDNGKTLVINVTSNFAASDTIVVSGLSFKNFDAPSAADNLELELLNDGAVQATDDKTITITLPGPIGFNYLDSPVELTPVGWFLGGCGRLGLHPVRGHGRHPAGPQPGRQRL